MASITPIVGVQGLTIPSYSEILAYLITQYKAIFGQNVYLGPDTADYQWISIIAALVSDSHNAVQLDYNNRAPNFAIGAALDSLVKINGLARKPASFSTCVVTVVGVVGTEIDNGIVRDANGNKWNLPAVVIIGVTGSTDVTATADVIGHIDANPATLTIIATPTSGWTSATNAAAAIPGQPVEVDSQLRARQALSAALPSITMLAGTTAAIAAVPSVTRYNVVENPTSVVDALGNPPHSITAVVEGGNNLDVATAIFNNRGIGCFTNGDTSVTVTDPNTSVQMPIRFERPSNVPIFVTMALFPLQGFTSAIAAAVQSAVIAYLNSLQIGEILTVSGLYGAAMSVTPNLSQPLFSIRTLFVGVAGNPNSAADVVMDFDEVAQGIVGNVIVNFAV